MALSEDHRAHLGALVAIAAGQTTHAFALLTLGAALAGALLALGREPGVESLALSAAVAAGLIGLVLAVSALLFALRVPPAPEAPRHPGVDTWLASYLIAATKRVDIRAWLLTWATFVLGIAGLLTVLTGFLLLR